MSSASTGAARPAVRSPPTSTPTRRSASRSAPATRTSRSATSNAWSARAKTLVVTRGVPHSKANPGSVAIEGVVELRPALHSKEMFEAFGGLASEGTTPRGVGWYPCSARVPRPCGRRPPGSGSRAVRSPCRASPGAGSTLRCSRWIQGTPVALTRAVVGSDPKVGRSRLSGRTRGSIRDARWLGYRCGRGAGLCRSLPALRP
jgi:hypothetical protein